MKINVERCHVNVMIGRDYQTEEIQHNVTRDIRMYILIDCKINSFMFAFVLLYSVLIDSIQLHLFDHLNQETSA